MQKTPPNPLHDPLQNSPHEPRQDYDILVLGEINVDLILRGGARPVFGQAEKVVADAAMTMGGSGIIFACGAARLGLRVAYCGVVGDDLFGRYMLDGLREHGVDPRGVHVRADQKTGLTVILEDAQDRALLTHLGAIGALRADMVEYTLLARTRHVHVSSYFLQHALQPGLPALLAEARRGGATVSLDTNWDPDEQWDHGLAETLAQTDIFLPNAQEAQAIARHELLNGADGALDALAATVPTVAIKLGADGALCRRGAARLADPGFAVDVVDTTGAGDSFDAGFVFGCLQKWSLADTLALACACGALSARAAGGTPAQPTLDEAQQLIRRRKA